MKMSELKNKKNSRAGHKSYLSYTFSKVDKCLKDYTEDIKNEIEQWKEAFQELEKVTTLSDQILTLIEAPIQARLPKLEVQKFGGNIGEWQEFWDSFESAIDKNLTLANINKFS